MHPLPKVKSNSERVVLSKQRLEPIVDEVEDVWKTVLYMSYATVQKHLAFHKML